MAQARTIAVMLLLALLLGSLLGGCSQSTPPPGGGNGDGDDDGGGGNGEGLVPPTTKVLDDAAEDALTTVAADGTLSFASDEGVVADLEAGDVVVAGIADAAPQGLLRRVTAVRREGGQVVVETAPAEIRDAIHEGSLSVELELGPEDLADTQVLQAGITTQAFEYQLDTDFGTGGTLQATGTLEVVPILDFHLGVSCDDKFLGFCVEAPDLNVRARMGVEEQADLELVGADTLGFNEEVPLVTHDFEPIEFNILGVPVVLTPKLTVYMAANGSFVGSFEAGLDQDLTLAAGFEYDSASGFEDLTGIERTFEHHPPTFEQGVDARAVVGTRFEVLLYGLLGPFASLEAGPGLQANVRGITGDSELLWNVDGCLWLFAGIRSVPVLDIEYEKELFDACVDVAEHANRPPIVDIDSPNPANQIYVGVPVTLRGAAIEPDLHDARCTWTSSVASDPFPVEACEQEVTFDATGTRTLTLTGTDEAGATAEATVTVEVAPLPDVLVTIDAPADGDTLLPSDPVELSGEARGGTAPYDYLWTVRYPTDETGQGGESFEIGPGASRSWTPNETLTITACGVSHGRLTLEATDAEGFGGSNGVVVGFNHVC